MGLSSWRWGALVLALHACGDDDAAPARDGGADGALDAAMDATVDADAHDASADAARDASPHDAALADAQPDSGDLDAGSDAGALPYATQLSQTGLYTDIANDVIAQDVIAFEPAYALWSDGALKRRFLFLPPGSVIDTSDMDHWVFPVGTKAWKEFSRDGVRIETRLLEKTESGWQMFAYLWNEANSEADLTLLPVDNARGTDHDVPSRGQCVECHGGEPDRLLGVGAIQLSHDKPGLTLMQLISEQRLSNPPAGPFRLPGDTIAQTVFGTLHANCGHCHQPGTLASERARGLDLWQRTSQLNMVISTVTYISTVGIDLTSFEREGYTQRIVPGEPERSALLLRMSERGNDAQMPPLGTEVVDQAAIDAVTAWIDRM